MLINPHLDMARQVVRHRPRSCFWGALSSAGRSVAPFFQGSALAMRRPMSGLPRLQANAQERSTSEPITYQGDVRRDYVSKKKRRTPQRLIRKRKQFKRRVEKIADKQLSPIKVLLTENVPTTAIVSGQQIICDGSLFLGTCKNNSVGGERDFSNIANALGDTSTSQSQLRFRSALLEVSFTNTSTNQSAYLEVYTVKARKIVTMTVDFPTFFTTGWTREPAALTGGTTLASTTYGVTPFNNRLFMENFKILKKETIFMPPTQTTNLTLKAKMPHIWNFDKEGVSTSNAFDKFTTGFIFVYYGTPSSTGAPAGSNYAYNVVRTYNLVNLRSAGLPASAQFIAA